MEVRLCVDCRHYRRSSERNLDLCMAHARVDLVRGEYLKNYASVQRENYGECKPQAVLWEPHPDTFTATEQESSHVEP